MKGKKVFISGPMSGYPDENFPAFDCWAAKLERAGCEVSNPAVVSRRYKTGKISYA